MSTLGKPVFLSKILCFGFYAAGSELYATNIWWGCWFGFFLSLEQTCQSFSFFSTSLGGKANAYCKIIN